MRAIIQRVSEASVKVDGKITGAIGVGLLVLLGIEDDDNDNDIAKLSAKISHSPDGFPFLNGTKATKYPFCGSGARFQDP